MKVYPVDFNAIALLVSLIGLSFIGCYLLIPLLKKLACKHCLYDVKTPRKIHSKNIPRIGGIGIFFGFVVGLLIARFLLQPWFELAFVVPFTLLGTATIMFLLGVYDDLFHVRAMTKLLVQFVAASAVYFLDIRIEEIFLFAGGVELGWLSFLFTVAWIIFITNAFNLIDGLDGLAGGVAVIALSSMAIFGFLNQQWTISIIALSLSGAVLAFLRYNFWPASIFMGDGGSYFVGFMLATLSIKMVNGAGLSASVPILVPLLILGVPIFDALLAIARRSLKYTHRVVVLQERIPNMTFSILVRVLLKRILVADNEHLHHLLLGRGLSQRATTLRLYGVSSILALAALTLLYFDLLYYQYVVAVLVSLSAVLAALKFGLAGYIEKLMSSTAFFSTGGVRGSSSFFVNPKINAKVRRRA